MKLQTGDKAPDFTTTASFRAADSDKIESRTWTLSEEVKKGPVLLIFYPGDFTSVCTKQLCDYRDNWESLNRYKVQLVGVSTNNKESHGKFVSTHKFPFALLDDSGKEISEKMGMLMSIVNIANRGFVLIDSNQTVRYTFKEVLPFLKRSASEVAEILQKHAAV